MTVDARLVKDDILARLAAALKTYDGEIPQDDPPPADLDGRVHGHAILYTGPGHLHATALCDTPRDMTWTGQVTAVGGDPNRCMWAVAKIRAALTGVRLTVAGAQSGLLVETGDPGPARRDDEPSPPRFYVPLPYGLDLTG